MAQCKAKSKRSGERCRRAAMIGKEVCMMHGGKTPRGTNNPNFKHGRYSKAIPDRLAARYNEAQNDSQLLELREDIALIDARISDLLVRVDTGESGAAWRRAAEAVQAFKTAQVAGKVPEMHKHLAVLTDTIEGGNGDSEAWAEVYAMLETRRKLVESERKRLVEMQQYISTERAMALIAAITDTVKRHVHDRTALLAISQDIMQITNRRIVDADEDGEVL